ncbi:MAG TPA: acyl-CoA dehydrogenase family protein [Pseudonocardiaceae bacterium]|nr:acyl-CoA dehydrogenase family protein [Pseudonocardiaceae bacterium]
MTTAFSESEERQALRAAVRDLAGRFGRDYFVAKARSGQKTSELWAEAGKLGYLGVNVAEEYGGGGGGIGDLAAVCEEFAAAGMPLLMMVVSPAICATVIGRFGTDEQKRRWLPGFADGTTKMAFSITEPDAGSNSHLLATSIRRDGDDWLLSGGKYYISGVDESDAVLVVARHMDASGQRLLPSLMIVPTDAPGFTYRPIEMDIISPERQFTLFFDDVRLPSDALVGSTDAGLAQLFAGLNPERIMAASLSTGMARFALDKAADYVRTRQVWGAPIGSHQGIAHPLAECAIRLEMARLMTQKAAALYDAGLDREAGESANMAKLAAADVAVASVDQAIQCHGGNGLSAEYGLAAMLGAARAGRIAPVSREMILNYVAQHTLKLPKSY